MSMYIDTILQTLGGTFVEVDCHWRKIFGLKNYNHLNGIFNESTMSNKQSMNNIIIDGYIREIEIILNEQNLIIPKSIIMMIWTYYQITKIVFCIIDQDAINNTKHANSIFMGNIHSINSIKTSKINTKSKSMLSISNSYCSTSNFKHSPARYTSKANKINHVIFRIGECQYQKNEAILIQQKKAYSWTIPYISENSKGSSFTFCEKNQMLISVGGESNQHYPQTASANCYALKFDKIANKSIDEETKWNWDKLQSMPFTMHHGSVCMNNKQNILMVVGGGSQYEFGHGSEGAIYNVDENKWKNNKKNSVQTWKSWYLL